MKKITSTLLALSVVGMSIFSNFAVIPTTFAKSSKGDEKILQPKFDSYKIELNDGYKIVSESVGINKNDDFIETSVYSREDFFDNDGKYQNTVLEISSFHNDFETGEAKNKFLTKTVYDEKGIKKLSSKKSLCFTYVFAVTLTLACPSRSDTYFIWAFMILWWNPAIDEHSFVAN